MRQSRKFLQDLVRFGKKMKQQRNKLVRLVIYVDRKCPAEIIARAKRELMPEQGGIVLRVEQFDSSKLPELCRDADFSCIFSAGGLEAYRLAAQLEALGIAYCLMLPAVCLQEKYQAENLKLSVEPLPYTADLDEFFEALAHRMLDQLEDASLACAASFPFIRRTLSQKIIHETARQNALIGAFIFIPGADMPVMSLNQMKMVIQIAAAYGQELSLSSLKELSVVLASGFLLRALARQAAGLVPFGGFALKASIAYSGTQLLGRSMIAYCEEGKDLSSICKYFMRSAHEKI